MSTSFVLDWPPLWWYRVEFLPLIFATTTEFKAYTWTGVYAHLNTVAMMPSPPPGDVSMVLCSSGVTISLILLLGRVRYVHTNWVLLFGLQQGLWFLVLLVFVFRIFRWWQVAPREE